MHMRMHRLLLLPILLMLAAISQPAAAAKQLPNCLWAMDPKKPGVLAAPPKPAKFGLLNYKTVKTWGAIDAWLHPEYRFTGFW